MKRLYSLILILTLAVSAYAQGPGGSVYEQGGGKAETVKTVNLYPNPTTEFVHVRLETMNIDHVKVSMHNIIGNELPIETEKVDDHELRIRVKDFDSGYYLLALRDEQSNFRGTYKFLKR
ncbi:T9SS type A sorting domain-containing protein [Chryseolinea sp. T2]|uniref:T9SS type A sorting domain-containing protein n=1 Tax=Chryseolinea sp. T2 TaxID=3129255 RepID=UPI0030784C89